MAMSSECEEDDELEYAEDDFVIPDMSEIRKLRSYTIPTYAVDEGDGDGDGDGDNAVDGCETARRPLHVTEEDIKRRSVAFSSGNMRPRRFGRQTAQVIGEEGSMDEQMRRDQSGDRYFHGQIELLMGREWKLANFAVYREFLHHIGATLFNQDIDEFLQLAQDIDAAIRRAISQNMLTRGNKQELIQLLERSSADDCIDSQIFIQDVRDAKTVEDVHFEKALEERRKQCLIEEEECSGGGGSGDRLEEDEEEDTSHKAKRQCTVTLDVTEDTDANGEEGDVVGMQV